MITFKQYLSEGFTNLLPDHEAEKHKHAEHVFNMVQHAYSPIGGIHGSGFKNHHDMVKNIPMWKLHKDSTGKVRAAALYKDKEGRKRVAIASDGSPEGKKGLSNIVKNDIQRGRSYAEISGPSLSFHKKQVDNLAHHAIPHHEVKRLMPDDEIRTHVPHDDPEVQRHPELKKHFYQRKIGDTWHTKIAVGTPGHTIK